jgi:hypothetical protein
MQPAAAAKPAKKKGFFHSTAGKVVMGLGGAAIAGVIGMEILGDDDDSGTGGGGGGDDYNTGSADTGYGGGDSYNSTGDTGYGGGGDSYDATGDGGYGGGDSGYGGGGGDDYNTAQAQMDATVMESQALDASFADMDAAIW